MVNLNALYNMALDYVGMVFFNPESIEQVQRMATRHRLLAGLLAVAAVLAIPVDVASVAPLTFARNYLVVLAGLALLLFLVLVAARLLGSRELWHRLLAGVVFAFFVAQLFFLPVNGLLVLAFDVVLRDATAVPLALSLIPFYVFVVFGWACEASSRLHGWRGVALAGVSITLVFAYHLVLAQLVV